MSDSTKRPISILRIDGRFGLGAVMLMLALFVGATFSTQAICLAFWLFSLSSGIVGERIRRRWESKAIRRVGKRAGGGHAVAKSIWRLVWQTSAMLSILIGALLFAFMWRVSDRMIEAASFLVLSVDMIGHYGLMVLCVLWTVWPHRGHVTMLVVGLFVVLASVAGGGVSRSLSAQTAVGLASVIGFVIAAQIVLSRRREQPTTLSKAIFSEEQRSGMRRESWPYSLLTLSIILITVSAVTQLTGLILPDVQAGVFAQLKDRFEETDTGLPVATSGYVSGRRLGSVQQTMLSNPTGIALRGYCDTAPGYLRGNVFDDYNRRSWRTLRRWIDKDNAGVVVDVYRAKMVPRKAEASVPLQEPANPFRGRFSLRMETDAVPMTGSGNRNDADAIAASGDPENTFIGAMEIHGEPEKGSLVFLPAAAGWVEARGELIGVTPHGLIDRGIESTQPWVAGVMLATQREVLTPEARSLMRWVGPELSDVIAPLAAEVCRDATPAKAKAERIAAFFQNNFRYTLETEAAPAGIDPIVHFLRTRHPAHCELFASASALMLRCQGVPARYVTGYVMDELHEDEEYYLARNRDAHAWVEYYDDQQQRWQALESTPGRVYQTLDKENQQAGRARGNDLGFDENFAAWGWLRSAWGYLRSLRITDVLAVVFRLLQIPLLVGLVGWLWWHRRRSRGDSQAIALAAARRMMDRRVRRRGWVRRQSETLHQFAARIETSLSVVTDSEDSGSGLQRDSKQLRRIAELREAAHWYRAHAVELYRCP